jgi:2-methylcitrate dehydratase
MNEHVPQQNGSSIASLAAWTLQTDPAYTTDLALRQAELLVLDSVGCAFASHDAGSPRRVSALVQELGGNPQCAAIGQGFRTSVLNATLLNCALVRSLDFNDVQFIMKEGKLHVGGHCSDTLASALAVGEMTGAHGRDVLTAIIMGYELFRRMRNLMPYSSVWDGTSALGLVAAAMAGRLLKLDVDEQTNALALAAARSATPSIVRYGELSGAKNMVSAFTAQQGVQAALLASKGMTGPKQILDHKWGLTTVFDPALGIQDLWAPISGTLYIMDSHVKTYACIGTAQSEIVAALEAHEKVKGRIEQIEAIGVTMADLPIIRKQQAEVHRLTPSTRETADHSFTFLPAVILIDGTLTKKQFENQRWDEPVTKELTAKVRLSVSAELAARAPTAMPCNLKIHMAGGEIIETECLYPPGHSFPDRGLNQAPVVEKFTSITDDFMDRDAQQKLIDGLLDLRNADSVAPLMGVLSVPPKY